ncbi:MAG: hypothetical protein EBU90_31030 [Proteobacteria bacterium]|nr:hypothetical protein [Pseudomonadota bacterium]NBP16938.1 hypothetical protein [bacterium]
MVRKKVKYYNALIKITTYGDVENEDTIPDYVEDSIDDLLSQENVWGDGSVWLEVKKFTQKRKGRAKK